MLLDPEGTIVARSTGRCTSSTSTCRAGSASGNRRPSSRATTSVVAPTPWGGLGLSICYDLRFPELYRAHAAQGARIIAVPSAFTLETGKDHWHVLLRARAIENQVYVMAPAQFGAHGPTRRSYGHALVVDPWGVVVAECGDQEGFALARLDFAYQDKVRAALPVPDPPAALMSVRSRRGERRWRQLVASAVFSAGRAARSPRRRRSGRPTTSSETQFGDAEAIGEQHLRRRRTPAPAPAPACR